MNTLKGKLFRYARKRGISAQVVRDILADLGAPPTLSEVGQRLETGWNPRSGEPDVPYTYRNPSDYREISSKTYQEAISIINDCHSLLEG